MMDEHLKQILHLPLSRRSAVATGTLVAAGTLGGSLSSASAQGSATLVATPTTPTKGQGMLTDVPGFLVGHATMETAITGCTVVICPAETTAGVEVLGGWPATREMEILSPLSSSPFIHAIFFTGRSVYGLAAADGVVRWIEEQRGEIPQVPGVVINDLAMGNNARRPGPEEGYFACQEATPTLARGSVGAGTGATVGKGRGAGTWMKGGIGSASRTFREGGVVAALAVVNAVGDILDRDGRIIAGAHDGDGRHIDFAGYVADRPLWPNEETASNTTLVAVATNARLTKTQCSIVAHMAQAGFPRAISPIFTPWDGDTVVVASSGSIEASDFAVGVLAAEVVADSIRDAVRQATSLAGVPDLTTLGTRSPDDPAWSQ